jgi:hypothetical protein
LETCTGLLPEKAAVVLLMQRPEQWGVQWSSQEASDAWTSLVDVSHGFSILEAELAFLREQQRQLDEVVHGGGGGGSSTTNCSN